jgi:hypothetical protein
MASPLGSSHRPIADTISSISEPTIKEVKMSAISNNETLPADQPELQTSSKDKKHDILVPEPSPLRPGYRAPKFPVRVD